MNGFVHRPLVIACCVASVILGGACSSSTEIPSARYDRARALYQEGPENRSRVIELLAEELKVNPSNMKARKLLGLTYFDTQQFDNAAKEFEIVIDEGFRPREDGSLSVPTGIIFLHIRALARKGKYVAAWETVGKYGAFLNTPEHKPRYDKTVDELRRSEQCSLSASARQAAKRAYGRLPDDCLFIVANEENLKHVENDGDLKHFLIRTKRRGRWASVVILPEGPKGPFAYAVYFQDHVASGCSRIPHDEATRERVAKAYKEIHTPAPRLEQEDGVWEEVQVHTDDDKPLRAFRFQSQK